MLIQLYDRPSQKLRQEVRLVDNKKEKYTVLRVKWLPRGTGSWWPVVKVRMADGTEGWADGFLMGYVPSHGSDRPHQGQTQPPQADAGNPVEGDGQRPYCPRIRIRPDATRETGLGQNEVLRAGALGLGERVVLGAGQSRGDRSAP